MSNIDGLAMALTSFALAQSLLSANILIGRDSFPDMRMPLIVFFLANAIAELSAMPAYFTLQSVALEHAITLSGLPATLLLAPAIWLYVVALTSEESVILKKRHILHLLPFVLGIFVCIAMAFISSDIREQIIGDAEPGGGFAVLFGTVLIVAITLINIGQLLGYMVPTFLRLIRYKARLKDLYASTYKRELTWVVWMLALLFINVVWALYSTFFEVSGAGQIVGEIANVALIWMLSIWGLEQLPGLRAEEALMPDRLAQEKSDMAGSAPKYERSALSDEQMRRIADKIEQAMSADKLYMDANLSLRVLAKHIASYPNYVSQTLNGKLGRTFFDFINGWRIREAMPRLAASDEQVTNIAYDVGFNSRSSFYNAFKKETGETPTQYRRRLAGTD